MRVILLLAIAGCLNAEFREIKQSFAGEECKSCESSLEKALGRIKGVTSVKVESGKGIAHLTLDADNNVRLSVVRDRIKGVGFKPGAAEVTVTARITGSAAVVVPSGEVFQLVGDTKAPGPTLRGTIGVTPGPDSKPEFRLSKTP